MPSPEYPRLSDGASPLDIALYVLAQGLHPVMLHPGTKRPVGIRWQDLACTTEEEVRANWRTHPDVGVGVICGRGHGVVVLDFDVNNGKPGLVTAERLLGPHWWQRVPFVRTPSGGVHLYLVADETTLGWGNRKLGQYGLDVQGTGSQVVAPGMALPGGEYTIMGADSPLLMGCPWDLGESMVLLLGEAGPMRAAEGTDELPADWDAFDHQEVAEKGERYLRRYHRVWGFLSSRISRPWQDDESRALHAVCQALALAKTEDGVDWAFSPDEALLYLVEHPVTYAVATKAHRRASRPSAAQWLWQYNLGPHMVERALDPLKEALGDESERQGPAGQGQAPHGGEAGSGGHGALAGGMGRGAPAPGRALDGAGRAVLLAPDGGAGEGLSRSVGAAGEGLSRSVGAAAVAGLMGAAPGPTLPPPAAPAAPALLAGGVAGPGPGGPAHLDSYPALLEAIEALVGRTQGEVLEAVGPLVKRTVDAELGPQYREDLLERLRQLGVSKGALRALVDEHRRTRRAEDRARDRARLDEERPPDVDGARPIEDYIFVEDRNELFNLVSRRWVKRDAYRATHDSEVYDEFFEQRRGPRAASYTFMPANPWAPGFDPKAHHLVRSRESGLELLNTWQAPYTRPKVGVPVSDEEVRPWLELPTLAGLPQVEVEHLLDLLAFKAQHPQVKVNHMAVLGGGSGTGKSTFLEPLSTIFGSYVQTIGHNVLVSDFDPDMSSMVVMRIEELASMGEHRASQGRELYNTLKPYCAAPPAMLSVTTKGKNTVQLPNLVLLLATTNHRDALMLEQDDRRTFMCWWRHSSEHHTQAWGERLNQWMGLKDADGYTGQDKVAGWLLARDVRHFNPGQQPPRTEWWREAIAGSRTHVAQAVRLALEAERYYGRRVVTLRELVLDVQNAMVEVAGDMKGVTAGRLGKAMAELNILVRRVSPPTGGTGTRVRNKVRVAVLDSKCAELSDTELWVLCEAEGMLE